MKSLHDGKLEVDEDWNEFLILRLFYGFVAFDFFTSTCNILLTMMVAKAPSVTYPVTLKFFEYLPWIPTLVVLLFLGFLTSIAAFANPKPFLVRVTSMLVVLLTKGFIFSQLRFAHHYWPMLLGLMFLAAVPSLKSKAAWRQCQSALQQTRIAIAFYYFLPGLWKIVSALQGGSLFSADFGPQVFAWYHLSHGKESFLGDFFIQLGVWCTLIYWLGIIFEMLTIWVVFKPKYFKTWSILILGFHLANHVILSINFFIAGIVFFIFYYFHSADLSDPEVELKKMGSSQA